MTRAQRIRAALAILGTRDEEEIDRAITAIDIVSTTNITAEMYASKQNKVNVKALRLALERVRVAYNALPDVVRGVAFDHLDLKKYVTACDDFIALPTSPKKPPAIKQRQAAAMAMMMLWQRDLPLLASSRSKWCQLAAILADEKASTMFPYVLEIQRRRKIK